MPAMARAELESLLRLKKLDHTLAGPDGMNVLESGLAGRWLVPTGIATLDERLQGGFPRGQMSEVARRLKIGRSTLYRKLDEAAADEPDSGAQGTN